MPVSELGPWGRIYFRIGVDKAHYSLHELGAFLKVWAAMGLVTPRGRLKRRAIIGMIGEKLFDFLVEEGDLIPLDEPEIYAMHRWDWYQAPLIQNAARQGRYRRDKAGGPTVDNVMSPDSNVTVTSTSRDATYSESDSLESTSEDGASNGGAVDNSPDALDRYYELTQTRPWGRRPGSWLEDLQSTHGVPNVVAALEVESRSDPSVKTLLGRVAARLEAQAHRVATAKAREPKKPTGLQAEIAASITARYGAEAVAVAPDLEAGRKLRESIGSNGANGIATMAASVLGSGQGAAASPRLSLTADEGSDTESAAVAPSGSAELGRSPSPARKGARLQSDTEPGERMTDPPPLTPDGRAN